MSAPTQTATRARGPSLSAVSAALRFPAALVVDSFGPEHANLDALSAPGRASPAARIHEALLTVRGRCHLGAWAGGPPHGYSDIRHSRAHTGCHMQCGLGSRLRPTNTANRDQHRLTRTRVPLGPTLRMLSGRCDLDCAVPCDQQCGAEYECPCRAA